jgi:hypothetical protein
MWISSDVMLLTSRRFRPAASVLIFVKMTTRLSFFTTIQTSTALGSEINII